MEIKRDLYLSKLIRKQKNGLIKVVTGIKGCGKSYLLFHLFHDHLLKSGMPPDHLIEIALDDDRIAELRDPDAILQFLLNAIQDQQVYCILLDEVQRLNEFEDILNTLLHIRNADVYVTGSHARGLSSDIITEFRGRGDEIRIHPLKFSEYLPACGEEPKAAWDNYLKYGGLPQLLAIEDPGAREDCLKSLLQEEYLPGIALRCGLQRRDKLGALLEVLAAAPDRCTSSLELSRSLAGMKDTALSDKTIKRYTDCLAEAFLISRSARCGIRNKRRSRSLSRYYFEDIGLKNACMGFRLDQPRLMADIICSELKVRGFHVDAGMTEHCETSPGGRRQKKQLEVDFIATRGSEKYYLQSVSSLHDIERAEQALHSLVSIRDSFKKIVVVGDDIRIRRNEDGINTIGLLSFLLDENSLNL